MAKSYQNIPIDTQTGVVNPDVPERRYIYHGEEQAPQKNQQDGTPRNNRPLKKKKRSAFNIIAAIFVVSFLTVFYVWNKITVNQLVVEVNDLQDQYQKTENSNDILRADINRKSSLERIGTLGTQMGLAYSKTQPTWFELNKHDIERLQGK